MLRPPAAEVASVVVAAFLGGGVASSASTSGSVHSRPRPKKLVKPEDRVFHFDFVEEAGLVEFGLIEYHVIVLYFVHF